MDEPLTSTRSVGVGVRSNECGRIGAHNSQHNALEVGHLASVNDEILSGRGVVCRGFPSSDSGETTYKEPAITATSPAPRSECSQQSPVGDKSCSPTNATDKCLPLTAIEQLLVSISSDQCIALLFCRRLCLPPEVSIQASLMFTVSQGHNSHGLRPVSSP